MHKKKFYFIVATAALVISAAALIGGRFLNQRINPSGTISVNIIPAVELPTTSPEVTGPLIERRDNTMIIETKSLDTGSTGVVSVAGRRNEAGPRVEVVITGETVTYRETTHLSELLSGGNQNIQQTVVEATLDELDSRSMVMVWGRKSGDRIIAEVLMYSNTVAIKRGLFEDCDECP